MLKSLTSIALLLTSASAMAQSYSEGYVVGSAKMMNEARGAMLLGNSSHTIFEDKQIMVGRGIKSSIKNVPVNAFLFVVPTVDLDVFNTINGSSINGSKVVLHYSQPILGSLPLVGSLFYKSPNVVDHVLPVNPQLRVDVCHASPATHLPIKGSTTGRIVKLSLNGYPGPLFVKTWEALVQVGDSETQFVNLTLTDASMVDCLLHFVDSNRVAKITFKEVKHPASLQYVNDIETVEPSSTAVSDGPVSWN